MIQSDKWLVIVTLFALMLAGAFLTSGDRMFPAPSAHQQEAAP